MTSYEITNYVEGSWYTDKLQVCMSASLDIPTSKLSFLRVEKPEEYIQRPLRMRKSDIGQLFYLTQLFDLILLKKKHSGKPLTANGKFCRI